MREETYAQHYLRTARPDAKRLGNLPPQLDLRVFPKRVLIETLPKSVAQIEDNLHIAARKYGIFVHSMLSRLEKVIVLDVRPQNVGRLEILKLHL